MRVKLRNIKKRNSQIKARFHFKKETATVSIEEEQYYKTKINNLKPTEFVMPNKKIFINHKLKLTMIEGKVCNSLSNTSSMTCYICEAKPTKMNNIEECLGRELKERYFKFGLSLLNFIYASLSTFCTFSIN